MSYYIDISFRKVENKLEAFELAQETMKAIAAHAPDYLEDNMFYSPLSRIETKKSEYDGWLWMKYEESVRQANRLWIRNLFNFRFMWWPEHKLLGVISCSGFMNPLGWKAVHFQNGTDQNYPYEDWENICPFFDELIEKSKNIPDSVFIEKMDSISREDYDTPERIAKYCDYHRKWAMYESVFDALDINSILYGEGKSDKYEYFSMNAIPDGDTYVHLEILSRAFAKKFAVE